MRSQTDGSPWSMRRATRGGGTDVPVTRPERLRAVALDLAAWGDYMRANARANRAYQAILAAEDRQPRTTIPLRKPRPECGTETAYKSHLRHGEDACRACKSAHSVYSQRMKEQNR